MGPYTYRPVLIAKPDLPSSTLLCAARGDKIAVLDKNAEAAKTTADEAMKKGAQSALGLLCDVSCEEQIEKAFEIIWNKIGAPYGLFTSAAIDLGGLVHELPATAWRQVLDTNLNGTFLACKYAIRKIRRADVPGSIVCASSPTGFVALATGANVELDRLCENGNLIAEAERHVKGLEFDAALLERRADVLVQAKARARYTWYGQCSS